MLQAIEVLSEEVQNNYESLHSLTCQGSVEDIRAMADLLHQDPDALHRICMPLLTTPLHHAATSKYHFY